MKRSKFRKWVGEFSNWLRRRKLTKPEIQRWNDAHKAFRQAVIEDIKIGKLLGGSAAEPLSIKPVPEFIEKRPGRDTLMGGGETSTWKSSGPPLHPQNIPREPQTQAEKDFGVGSGLADMIGDTPYILGMGDAAPKFKSLAEIIEATPEWESSGDFDPTRYRKDYAKDEARFTAKAVDVIRQMRNADFTPEQLAQATDMFDPTEGTPITRCTIIRPITDVEHGDTVNADEHRCTNIADPATGRCWAHHNIFENRREAAKHLEFALDGLIEATRRTVNELPFVVPRLKKALEEYDEAKRRQLEIAYGGENET